MNSFEKVIQDYGVNDQSHSEPLLHALLVYASTDYEGADTHTNAVREVVRRLEARGVGKIALDIIRAKLNTLQDVYDRR